MAAIAPSPSPNPHPGVPSSPAPAPRYLRQPLLWTSVAFAVGTCFARFVDTAAAWTPPSWELLASVAVLGASMFWIRTRPAASMWLTLVSIALLGASAYQLSRSKPFPALPPELENDEVEITGYVTRASFPALEVTIRNMAGRPSRAEMYQQLDVATDTIRAGERTWQLRVGVRVNVYRMAESQDADADSLPAEQDPATTAEFSHRGPQRAPVLRSLGWSRGPQRAPVLRSLGWWSYGQQLRVSGKIRSPRDFGDPGVWDRRTYLRDRGIVALLTANPANIQMLPGWSGTRWGLWRAQARRSLLRHVLALHMRAIHRYWGLISISEPDAALLAAMILGERSLLDQSVKLDFQRTGSYHLLVVSGLAVAILAFTIFRLACWLRLGEAPATILTAVLIAIYAFLTDLGAPVQRAVLMCCVYLVVRLLYRDRNSLNALGAAAMVVLIGDPSALFDVGFQMTFLAVLTIAGIALPVLERISQPNRKALRQIDSASYDLHLAPRQAQLRIDLRMLLLRLELLMPGWVARLLVAGAARFALAAIDLVFISALMQAALALPMAAYFHRATTLALPANLVVVPLMGLLLPLAIGTTLLSYAGTWLAFIPRCATALLLHLVSTSVFTFAHIKASDLRLPDPPLWAAILSLLALVAALLSARRRWALVASSLALLAASNLVLLHARAPEIVAGKLEITAIDVGQGDSLLVVTPQGKTLLMDGGGALGAASSGFDTGEDIVSPYLWARGFSRLDAVALSHAHGDHIGGLPAVLKNFRPTELWVAPSPPEAAYQSLIQQANASGITVRTRSAGERFQFGGAGFVVLSPPPEPHLASRRGNEESQVLRISYGNTSALLEGDAERRAERLFVPVLTPVNLLKVAHHGSVTSSIPELIAAAQPQFAVISVGKFNRYGHPRAEVLTRLADAGACIFRTDLMGAISFYMDGERLTAARWGPERMSIQFPARWIPQRWEGHCAAVR